MRKLTKIKAVVFDVTGMLVPGRRFSHYFSQEYNLPMLVIEPFFMTDFQCCLVGKKDLKKILPVWLKKWSWKKGVDAFLAYWFLKESKLDKKLLTAVKKLQQRNIGCYIATNQEKYRLSYLKKEMGLQGLFNGIFGSCQLGYKKPDVMFFQKLQKAIGYRAEQILYWDDQDKNTQAALKLGFKAETFKNFGFFRQMIKKYLEIKV